MSQLRTACPNCLKTIKYSDRQAGRRVACPACKSPLVLPRGTPDKQTVASPDLERKQKELELKQQELEQRERELELRNRERLAAESTIPQEKPYPAQPPLMHQQPAPIQQIVVNTPVAPVQRWNPAVALILSFIFPGLGQIYKGQPINGIVWIFAVILGYICLIVPGIILHLCCIVGAAMGDPYR